MWTWMIEGASVKCSNFIGTTGVHIKLIKDPNGRAIGKRFPASSGAL